MSTIKFDLQDDLDELQAKIFLDTKKKLSKKEILELAFRFGKRDYHLFLKWIENKEIDDQILSTSDIDDILSLATDLGSGSENLSSDVDSIYE